MRSVGMRYGVLGLASCAAACWADFPDKPWHDGFVYVDSAPRRDLAQRDSTTLPPRRDGGGTSSCTPNAFVRCAGESQLVKCDAQGSGTITVSCGAATCDATLRRCTSCEPGAAPSCREGNIVFCSADGLEQVRQCPSGCKDGVCCTDADGDKHSACDGDCNDNDPKVYPGQDAFQTTASDGSFDYNCDGREEQQRPDLAEDCVFQQGACSGSGWQGAVPKCGAEGSFIDCIPRSSSCVPKAGRQRQACR